MVKKKTYLVLN